MALLVWVFYLVIGKIIIHIWLQFHLPKFLQKSEWFSKLHECDLCSGVWIYFILSAVMGIGLLEVTGFGNYPLIDSIITGIVTSWVVHIFSLGWKAKYSITVI
jgi:hypothetical protein